MTKKDKMNVYIFSIIHVDEIKPTTFKIRAKDKVTAETIAKMLNPNVVLSNIITEEEIKGSNLPFGVRII